MASKSELPVVFGAMTLGKPGIEGVRVTSVEDAEAILDVFQAHGHKEIDTARLYGAGSSESLLADARWKERGLVMETKLYPSAGKPMGNMSVLSYNHTPEDLRQGLKDSLEALGTTKIDMWYLHGPDRKIPFEETLREVNNLHQQGYFARLGISNYMSWEVAQICEICEKNGWIKPTVYQGIYNALHRAIEPELLTCLRHYKIALYCFQPLAGGFLTSRYRRDMSESDHEPGSRFDPKRWQGNLHRGRYWNDFYFDALDIIRPVAKQYGLTEVESALRWLSHHSGMKKDYGDAIIIGASSAKQLEQNLLDMEKEPLPQEMVEALDAAWLRVKGVVPSYFH
ncbi:NADP-dependent oxidoreductase domain-containing protein [Penicillium argentinense]|uniref:NADP-dependent oxidoreductase domain-containing protein n=1 Tax=Penicillium argentinense TaxID=1131581 RepID=A0A9W9K6W9_9EURO|nr:NADP-dependent oxidoreductase domain-containing protein [Penicillium argentinense]KAJ5094995.1 NADP-dependent oxidoreductase domain-containing protein [Penicillium argentinense]